MRNICNEYRYIYPFNVYPNFVEENNRYNEEEDGVRDLQSGPQEIVLDYTLNHQSYDEMEGGDIHVVDEEDEPETPRLVNGNPSTEFTTIREDEAFQCADNTDEETSNHTSRVLL